MKTIQRIVLITVLFFTDICTSKSQTYVHIPDANFATYLKGLIPSAMNGNSLNITSTLVTTGTQTMIVKGDNISSLSGIQYFTSLARLECSLIGLTSIPNLPNSLQFLDCSSNNLTELPAVPKSLISLVCYHNFLSSLPVLPNSLTDLNCQFNSLTNLPVLPNSLVLLECFSNKITHFPSFPNSLTYINFSPNPYTCLPNYVLPAMKSYTTIPLCGK